MSYDDVEIEDMEWNEDLNAFTYPCPCGDLFQITKVQRTYLCACGLLTSQRLVQVRASVGLLLCRRSWLKGKKLHTVQAVRFT